MPTIADKDLKPCKNMFTIRSDGLTKGGIINLRTRCDHSMCRQGCFDGTGDCKDYVRRKRITADIRYISKQIEKAA